MTEKEEIEVYFHSLIESVQYDRNAFTIWYSEDKVVLGAILNDDPEAQKFFNYATIYNTIVDTDAKIKYSFDKSIEMATDIDFDKWNPLNSPSKKEMMSIYYIENAVFRTSVLWDLLAQLFNIKEGLGKSFDRVYTLQIFRDAQQRENTNPFAERVYAYMVQADNSDVEPWEGNYEYVKDFRNKMTHRASPNISSLSEFAMELRMPAIYILKRVIEDYKQVSEFIQELIVDILKDYEKLNNVEPLNEEQNNA